MMVMYVEEYLNNNNNINNHNLLHFCLFSASTRAFAAVSSDATVSRALSTDATLSRAVSTDATVSSALSTDATVSRGLSIDVTDSRTEPFLAAHPVPYHIVMSQEGLSIATFNVGYGKGANEPPPQNGKYFEN